MYAFNIKDLSRLLEEGFAYKDEPVEFIRIRYERHAKNFDEALGFLIALGLIRRRAGSLIVSQSLRSVEHPVTLEQIIKDALLRSHAFKEVHQLILKFNAIEGRFEYSPGRSERFVESDVRNLLISLKIVEYDREEDVYTLSPSDYEVVFSLTDSTRRKLSLNALRAIQARRVEIGNKAEKIVLEHEKNRLASNQELAAKVIHTAELDVTAGYDIESFEAIDNDNKRFIEVKAVSPYDFRFEWSTGEVQAAKVLQEQYFLYLLPVLKGVPSFKDVVIIQNPSKQLVGNREWVMKVTGYNVAQVPK